MGTYQPSGSRFGLMSAASVASRVTGVLKGNLHRHTTIYLHRTATGRVYTSGVHTHTRTHNIIYIYIIRCVYAWACVRVLYSGPLSPRVAARSVGKLSSHYCRFHKGRAGTISGNPLSISLTLPPHHPESYSRRHSSSPIIYTLYDTYIVYVYTHTHTRARVPISMVQNNII